MGEGAWGADEEGEKGMGDTSRENRVTGFVRGLVGDSFAN